MDVPIILEQWRILGYIDSTQADDDQMIIWLNFVYKKFCAKVKAINENYFYDRLYFDTVAYQNKYEFALPTAIVAAPNKALNIAIKYQADTYTSWAASTVYALWDKVMNNGYAYVCSVAHTSGVSFDATKFTRIYENYADAREVDYSSNVNQYNDVSIDPFIDRYWSNISLYNPVFTLTSSNASGASAGNKMVLNLYPAVQTVIKDGIQVDYLKTIIDLLKTTLEADVLVERDYHEVLVMGLLPYIFQRKGMRQERIDAIADYKALEDQVLAEITDRVQSSTTVQSPNLAAIE